MATTTNFGWETPDDTDLVKDGAAAIRTSLNGVDSSFVDLKGGTTGQILSKASGTDLDYTWIDQNTGDITGVTAGTGISGGGTSGTVTVTNSMATAIDAKGDLIAGTGADAFSRLAVGSNDQVLMADSTTSTGLKWGTPSSGGKTLISTTTLTGSTVTLSSFSGYKDLQLIVIGAYGGNQLTFHARFNSDTASNYWEGQFQNGANGQASSRFVMGDGLSNSSSGSRNVTVMNIQRYAESNAKPVQIMGSYVYWSNTSTDYMTSYVNKYVGSAITSIDLYLSSGSFTAGTAYLYGVN